MRCLREAFTVHQISRRNSNRLNSDAQLVFGSLYRRPTLFGGLFEVNGDSKNQECKDAATRVSLHKLCLPYRHTRALTGSLHSARFRRVGGYLGPFVGQLQFRATVCLYIFRIFVPDLNGPCRIWPWGVVHLPQIGTISFDPQPYVFAGGGGHFAEPVPHVPQRHAVHQLGRLA